MSKPKKPDVQWSKAHIRPFEFQLGEFCYFLPIRGKLFGRPLPYFFPQSLMVMGNQIYCSWSARDQVENLLRRRGVNFETPAVSTMYLGVGFAYPKDGSQGNPWLEPTLVHFASNPVTGEKGQNDWVVLEGASDGFRAHATVRHDQLDFLPPSASQSMLQRIHSMSAGYPDFSRQLPFPTRKQVEVMYKLSASQSLLIKPSLLPFED